MYMDVLRVYVRIYVSVRMHFSFATTGVDIYLSSIETQVTIASNCTVTNIDSVN